MRRKWTFYVQAAALSGFSMFALLFNCWFVWRAIELRQLGDIWLPALCIGSVLGPLFLLFSGILWTLFYKLAVPQRVWNAPREEIRPSEMVLMNPILDRPSTGVLVTAGVLAAVAFWAVL